MFKSFTKILMIQLLYIVAACMIILGGYEIFDGIMDIYYYWDGLDSRRAIFRNGMMKTAIGFSVWYLVYAVYKTYTEDNDEY